MAVLAEPDDKTQVGCSTFLQIMQTGTGMNYQGFNDCQMQSNHCAIPCLHFMYESLYEIEHLEWSINQVNLTGQICVNFKA